MRNLLVLPTILIWVHLQAQHYPMVSFTVNEGLIQNQVTALGQDSRGYLLIGTKGGFSLFDGSDFINIPSDKLTYGNVIDFSEDKQGNTWLATNRGICKYNGKSIQKFPLDNVFINAITVDREGKIWRSRQLMELFHNT